MKYFPERNKQQSNWKCMAVGSSYEYQKKEENLNGTRRQKQESYWI